MKIFLLILILLLGGCNVLTVEYKGVKVTRSSLFYDAKFSELRIDPTTGKVTVVGYMSDSQKLADTLKVAEK